MKSVYFSTVNNPEQPTRKQLEAFANMWNRRYEKEGVSCCIVVNESNMLEIKPAVRELKITWSIEL